jgi:hypothetical protein
MDYKGIYYGESKLQKFFEFGAHFKYSDLYRLLENLGGILPDNKEKPIIRNKSNESRKNISLISEEQKNQTRNIKNKIYLNNPNTDNININKTINLGKIRKKSGSKNSNNKNLRENSKKMKINIHSNNLLTKEKEKNNILSTRNTNKHLFIYQIKTNNEIFSLKTQTNCKINNNNIKFNSLNSPQNKYIKYSKLMNIHSRNKNQNELISPIKSEERKNVLSKDYNNDILFSKILNKKKYNLVSPNFRNKKNNNNLSSGKNNNKQFTANKLNSDRYSSGENLLIKNFKYYKSLGVY